MLLNNNLYFEEKRSLDGWDAYCKIEKFEGPRPSARNLRNGRKAAWDHSLESIYRWLGSKFDFLQELYAPMNLAHNSAKKK